MTITELRSILRESGFGAKKIEGTRYGVTSNGDVWFSLDIQALQDEKHARDRIQQELEYRKEVATRRWQ